MTALPADQQALEKAFVRMLAMWAIEDAQNTQHTEMEQDDGRDDESETVREAA